MFFDFLDLIKSVFDPASIINVSLSVSIGSVLATLIVMRIITKKAPKLTADTVRKSIITVLEDKEIQRKVSLYIKDHIVEPFNSLNNRELKTLINDTAEKSLELLLKKLHEKEKLIKEEDKENKG